MPAVAALLMVATAACGGGAGTAAASRRPTTVRLGYFPNVTHATAIVGIETGVVQEALGLHRLDARTFNAGPAAVEALFAKAVDAAYIGPNPAINAHVQSRGAAIRIVAGATSGGALLVVRPSVDGPAGLRGRKVASPQRGGTQDVALRHWLRRHGMTTDLEGGGDVSIVPQDNAQTLETFRRGEIDGAWVPEPWATRLVMEGGGKVLVDEKSLWPGGRFATTQLVVRTEFLEEHPEAVRALLRGHVRANAIVNESPAEARRLVNQGITRLTGRPLSEAIMGAAWESLEFTNDTISSSLEQMARHAEEAGVLRRADLRGLYDLTLLGQVLAEGGRTEVRG